MVERQLYEGATLHVRSYDSMHEPPPPALEGDVAFYEALARRAGGPLLEIGVGTGRVALALASAGLEVVGLDASAAMLAVARENAAALPAGSGRLTLVEGDMRTLALERAFGAVIVPFRAFQVLATADDQRRALDGFRRHLRPDGLLALHLFDPNLRVLLPGEPQPVERRLGVDRATGRLVEALLEETSFDHVAQIRRDVWRHRALDAAGLVVEEETLVLALRWTWRWEMRHLLALAGFAVEAECSDFRGSPPAYGREQVWVARPA